MRTVDEQRSQELFGKISSVVAERQGDFVEELQELCRIPTVSAKGQAMREGAEFVAGMLGKRGVSARIVETNGHPAVLGTIQGRSPKTLLMYSHYDVQPPDPLDAWRFDPFSATVDDGKLYARGAYDHKSSLAARIQAVEVLQTIGELPITIKFLFEGEEEIGSPSLADLLAEHRTYLQADAAVYSGSVKNDGGHPLISAGAKGMCYAELSIEGASSEMHSSRAPLVPNPAWQLTWTLATIKGADDRCLIDGFYDDVEPPSAEDERAVREMPVEDDKILERLGIDAFVGGVAGWEAILTELFSPTCTICGLSSGYQGAGAKTVLPNAATAKLEFRLVPNQRASDVYDKLVRHLNEHALGKWSLKPYNMADPDRVPLDSRIVQVIKRAGELAYPKPPLVLPLGTGSGPRRLFREALGVPMVSDCGAGYHLSGPHAPNEHIRLSDYLENIAHIGSIYALF